MRRFLSLILVLGLVLNIVVPVCASEATGDCPETGNFWGRVIKAVDAACATLGVVAVTTGGAPCTIPGVGQAACGVCAGWAFARAVGGLAGE